MWGNPSLFFFPSHKAMEKAFKNYSENKGDN